MDSESAELPNQPGELAGYNLFSSHSALVEALAREGDDFQALIERVFH